MQALPHTNKSLEGNLRCGTLTSEGAIACGPQIATNFWKDRCGIVRWSSLKAEAGHWNLCSCMWAKRQPKGSIYDETTWLYPARVGCMRILHVDAYNWGVRCNCVNIVNEDKWRALWCGPEVCCTASTDVTSDHSPQLIHAVVNPLGISDITINVPLRWHSRALASCGAVLPNEVDGSSTCGSPPAYWNHEVLSSGPCCQHTQHSTSGLEARDLHATLMWVQVPMQHFLGFLCRQCHAKL